MIKDLHLINYKCFEDTRLSFREITILVGKNNAGKSSLVEALRMIALALRKSQHTTYKNLPEEFGLPIRERGIRLDVEKLKIDLRGIIYNYGDAIARIEASFEEDFLLRIYVNTDYAYAVFRNKNGKCITNKEQAHIICNEKVAILPQIGLIKENEKRLANETIEKERETYLSSRHFRNEVLNYKKDYWSDFVELSQKTWKGLRIQDIEYNLEDDLLRFFVSDSGFSAEIGLMGSGLQMWLQIMWFLARTKADTTVILDEPDVYMHPDLQRKLIRIVKARYPQVIIATHSIEMISEVEPCRILTIDKSKRKLNYASDMKAVQNIIDDMGEVNNLSLVRLGNAKKCVFVEGKDLKILSRIAEVLLGRDSESLETLPNVSLGGFHNLRETYGTAKLLAKETNGMIKCICILDSDYFPRDLIEEEYRKAENNKLHLHIWERKEIENYLIEPTVLFRLSQMPTDKYDCFMEKLEQLVDQFKDRVFDQYAEHIKDYRKINVSEANKEARIFVDGQWRELTKKIELVGGKELLKAINKWFKEEYGVQLSIQQIIAEFRPEEFDEEMSAVINMLAS